MADSLSNENTVTEQAEEMGNPLLKIDTSFRTYLNVYTRSFDNHVVGGSLDYAFDSDFAVRQKLSGVGGWGRLYRAITTGDISAEGKECYMNCIQAGPLKYPEVYDILKKCSERLELNPPILLISEDEHPRIYSLTSDSFEPSVVISKGLLGLCTPEELKFLIGSECGRLQNNHTAFCFAFTYLNYNKDCYKPTEHNYKQPVSNQLVHTLIDWARYADITADRAGMICLDEPKYFGKLVCDLYEKGYTDFFGRKCESMGFEELFDIYDKIREEKEPRRLALGTELPSIRRRIIAGMDFLECVTLYNWRMDIKRPGYQLRSQQMCDIRCNLIMGTEREV
ncbi:MAG: M48 family metalloprotease [Ruminococcus sp.]|nr:M48 family metalloprotease [Ruminococcus sp.]